MLSVAFRKGNPRLHVVDERSKPRSIGADELSEPPHAVGTVELPEPYNPQQPRLPAPGGRGAPPGAHQPPRRRRSTTSRRRSTRPSSPPRRTPWPTAPTARPTSAALIQAERVARELDDLAAAGAGPHRVARPPVRPRAAPARGLGLPRRLGAHGLRRGAGPHLPRVRPARRRGHDHRAARRPRRPVAGRAGVVLHLRAPRAGTGHPTRGSRPRRSARGSSSCAGSPTTWPPTRRPPASRRPAPPDAGFVHLAHAWAAGDGLAPRARGRGALGRRLRAEREAAHRPAPRHRRRRTGRRPPPPGPARPPRRCTAAWSRPAPPSRSTRPEGSRLCRSRRVSPGASPGRCPATAWSCAPTPRRAPSSPRHGEPASRSRRSGCSAATCAAPSAAPATRPACAPTRPCSCPSTSARCSSTAGSTGSWPTSSARHGWWRGRVVAAMNAEFLGDVGRRAPRPPQRRPSRRPRRRPALRRAAPGASPAQARHPRARTRGSTSATRPPCSSSFDRPTPVYLDGAAPRRPRQGRCRSGSNPTPSSASCSAALPRPVAVGTAPTATGRRSDGHRCAEGDNVPCRPGSSTSRPARIGSARSTHPPVGRRRRGGAARSPAPSTTWTCGSPGAGRGRRCPTCPAATWPASSRRWATASTGWAVGDEVVVNPAVAPLEAIVASATTRRSAAASRSSASSAGAATPSAWSCPLATSSPARPGARGRSAPPTRWPPSPRGGCSSGPGWRRASAA